MIKIRQWLKIISSVWYKAFLLFVIEGILVSMILTNQQQLGVIRNVGCEVDQDYNGHIQ